MKILTEMGQMEKVMQNTEMADLISVTQSVTLVNCGSSDISLTFLSFDLTPKNVEAI